MSQSQNPTSNSLSAVDLRNLIILLGLSSVLYFWNLGSLPFYERGEGREGLVVWEMYHSGNWILPMVNGEYIPFKPPLFHWIGAIASSLGGHVDEFTVRFPSALLASLGVLMTYWVGRCWWNRSAGLAAGLVLVTCFGWWQAAAMAQVDMVLAFLVAASLVLFYSLYRHEQQRNWKGIALAVLLALATLAKGPLGIAAPAFVVLLFLLLQKDLKFVIQLPLLGGTAIYILLAGSWYALAYSQAGWSFIQRQIVDETLLTGVGNYGRHQPFYYYLPVLFYNLTPWSFLLPGLALFLFQRRRQLTAEGLLFPLAWILGILIFYSAARGKRGIYILPLYPAVALLFGAWWSNIDQEQGISAGLTRWIGWFYAVFCAIVVSGFALYLLQPPSMEQRFQVLTNKLAVIGFFDSASHGFDFHVKISMVVLAVCAIFLAGSLWKKKWTGFFACLAAIGLVQLLLIKNVYFPHFIGSRTLKSFMSRVAAKIEPSTMLVFYRAFDAGSIFYAGRHIPQYEDVSGKLKQPYFLLMWEEDFRRLSEKNNLVGADFSEGRGPALRHRMVLVEPSGDTAILDKELRQKSSGED
jgi:4-amino-4-deoxy-L-arabinose transferase-like glycosyltransferase